jgi:bifunctional non-homologous end joining protein LigD
VASFPGEGLYLPGKRTRNWLKVKHYQRETFLVGGYVSDRDQVRSLLVGLPDPARAGGLRFCGRVDHGLVPAARRRVRELLAPLVVAEGPFAEPAALLLGGTLDPARGRRPGPGVRPPRAGRGG